MIRQLRPLFPFAVASVLALAGGCDPADGDDAGESDSSQADDADPGDASHGDGPFDDPAAEPADAEPNACTPYPDDCDESRPCCASNVCAYGGERDVPWCQPFEAWAWEDACVLARAGAAVYRGDSVCRTINGEEYAVTCLEVANERCTIGYNGDCGEGAYTIRIRDLVQQPLDTCPL